MYDTIQPADRRRSPDAVAIALTRNDADKPGTLAELDGQTGGCLRALLRQPSFKAAKHTVTPLYPPDGPVVHVVGLGEAAALSADVVRNGFGAVAQKLPDAAVGTVRVDVAPRAAEALSADTLGRAVGEGLGLGAFRFDELKGAAASESNNGESSSRPSPGKLRVQIDQPLRDGLKTGLQYAASANVARRLAATPPNIANPQYLVRYCRKMARDLGLSCRIIDADEAKKLKMGGLIAVGAGSDSPPALICLEWNGPGRKNKKPRKSTKPKASSPGPLLLVGKAVTFDTGGYSIKIKDGMQGMKYDKCGGMAVIGAMHAIASLKLKQRVVGLVPTAENMIDEDAYRVDDIITMHNGVTVEVTNTDAEGRLILADALSYGCRTWKPRAVVDLATLTGGVVTALGHVCAGAFVDDNELKTQLFDAGEAEGERLWRLPLWDEHREQMTARHADIVNSAGRDAHPIQGAAFLSYFVGPKGGPSDWRHTPWCHLDIAGVAHPDKDTPLYTAGPSGFGVRLLTRWVEAM